MKAARKLQRLQQPASLIEFVRQFLTPRVWKQARQCVAYRRLKPRWDLQPLVLVLLAMTWAAGDAESERFVAARGFYVAALGFRLLTRAALIDGRGLAALWEVPGAMAGPGILARQKIKILNRGTDF